MRPHFPTNTPDGGIKCPACQTTIHTSLVPHPTTGNPTRQILLANRPTECPACRAAIVIDLLVAEVHNHFWYPVAFDPARN